MSAEFDPEYTSERGLDLALLRRLLAFARPHRRRFALGFGIVATLFALELAGPWVWRSAIDGPVAEAVRARATGLAGGEPAWLGAFLTWIGIYLAIVLGQALLTHAQTYQLGKTGQLVIHDLRVALFAHLQRLDLDFFEARPSGSLVTRVTSDVENLNELYTSVLVVLLFDVVKILALLSILFMLDVELATLVLTATPLLVGVSLVFRGGARRAHRLVRARLAALNGYLQEVLSGIRVVQVFRRERAVADRFRVRLGAYVAANLRALFFFALFFPAVSLLTTLTQGGAIWVGGHQIAAGPLSYGELLQFWFYLAMLVAPIRELGERYNVLQSAFASAERVFQILDTRPRVSAPPEPRPIPESDGRLGTVRFEHVTFRYPDGTLALREVTFEIEPGRTVAIVGATGAGKSTLIQLLLRFRDPDEGRITIGGIDLREFDPRALRRRLGLVLQEDFLFRGTVRDNLLLGREEIGEQALAEAIESSRAELVLERVTGGLEGEVAERGATLSTGERQLLAIARALAGRPALVVLDEATASVDSETEARIEEATTRLLERTSALVVAHRLSTVRRADRIVVLHKGELREAGTHAELLALGGLYARLHALSFDGELPPSAPRTSR